MGGVFGATGQYVSDQLGVNHNSVLGQVLNPFNNESGINVNRTFGINPNSVVGQLVDANTGNGSDGRGNVQSFFDPLNIEAGIRDAFSGPDFTPLVEEQRRQFQETLLRNASQANLKDLQQSQLAAAAYGGQGSSTPGLALNPSSSTNFLGGV